MALEIKIPSPGESISEVELTSWFVEDGALVNKNQELGEIESEKATLPLIATEAGQVKIMVEAGETLKVGAVVATIDTSVEVPDDPAESKEAPAAQAADPKDSSKKEPAAKPSDSTQEKEVELGSVKATPVAKQMMEKEGLSVDDIVQGLKKITANDVKQVMAQGALSDIPQPPQEDPGKKKGRK